MKIATVVIFCALFLCACDNRTRGIETAMQQYDRFILHMDADSIALCFAADGRLGKVAGRDAIRAFLKTFDKVKVLEQASTSDTVTISDDLAHQSGRYRQKVIVQGDTILATGRYDAAWAWDGQHWLLKQMDTTPDKK